MNYIQDAMADEAKQLQESAELGYNTTSTEPRCPLCHSALREEDANTYPFERAIEFETATGEIVAGELCLKCRIDHVIKVLHHPSTIFSVGTGATTLWPEIFLRPMITYLGGFIEHHIPKYYGCMFTESEDTTRDRIFDIVRCLGAMTPYTTVSLVNPLANTAIALPTLSPITRIAPHYLDEVRQLYTLESPDMELDFQSSDPAFIHTGALPDIRQQLRCCGISVGADNAGDLVAVGSIGGRVSGGGGGGGGGIEVQGKYWIPNQRKRLIRVEIQSRHKNKDKRVQILLAGERGSSRCGPTYGFEWEVEITRDTSSREVWAGYVDKIFNVDLFNKGVYRNDYYFDIEQDSSLAHGVEAVSWPATLATHKKILHEGAKDPMSAEVLAVLRKSTTAGFHVHVGKQAFHSGLALYKLIRFIHSKENERFITDIAGRYNANDYARVNQAVGSKSFLSLLVKSAKQCKNKGNPMSMLTLLGKAYYACYKQSRYSALSFCDKTIEFRLFAGATTFDEIRSYLECTDALIQWSNNTALSSDSDSVRSFVNYVYEQGNKYRSLQGMLKKKGYAKKALANTTAKQLDKKPVPCWDRSVFSADIKDLLGEIPEELRAIVSLSGR